VSWTPRLISRVFPSLWSNRNPSDKGTRWDRVFCAGRKTKGQTATTKSTQKLETVNTPLSISEIREICDQNETSFIEIRVD
jgi:hypothetical protein